LRRTLDEHGALVVVMAGLAVVALVVLELYVIITVVHAVGIVPTLALLIVVPMFGAAICKRQGLAVVQRIRYQLDSRRMPGADLLDGLWILVAGALLLIPGFVTDGIGLLLLLPPVRAGVNRLVSVAVIRRITMVFPGSLQ